MKKISTVLIIGLLMSLTSCMTDMMKDAKAEGDKMGESYLTASVPGMMDSEQKDYITVELEGTKNVAAEVSVNIRILDDSIVHFTEDHVCKVKTGEKCHIAIQAGKFNNMDPNRKTLVTFRADGYADLDKTISVLK